MRFSFIVVNLFFFFFGEAVLYPYDFFNEKHKFSTFLNEDFQFVVPYTVSNN